MAHYIQGRKKVLEDAKLPPTKVQAERQVIAGEKGMSKLWKDANPLVTLAQCGTEEEKKLIVDRRAALTEEWIEKHPGGDVERYMLPLLNQARREVFDSLPKERQQQLLDESLVSNQDKEELL
jgi:hypothetical protein